MENRGSVFTPNFLPLSTDGARQPELTMQRVLLIPTTSDWIFSARVTKSTLINVLN